MPLVIDEKLQELSQDKEDENNNLIEVSDDVEGDEVMSRLNKIDIKDKSRAEFVNMFQEFCGERYRADGTKLKPKNTQGINQTLNYLEKGANDGYNPYDIIEYALGKQWQGFKDEILKAIEKDLDYLNNKSPVVKNLNNIVYTGRIQAKQNIIHDDEKFLNEMKHLKEQQPEKSLYELVCSTTYGQQQYLKNMTQLAVKEKTQKDFNTYKANLKNDALKVRSSCELYSKDTPQSKMVLFNVLSSTRGRSAFDLLATSFAGEITIKYPNDKDRYDLFIQLANNVYKSWQQLNIKYVPVLFVYWYFNLKTKEPTWTNTFTYSFFDDVCLLDGFNKRYNTFLLDKAFFVKTEEEYINGCFCSVIKKMEICEFLNDVFMCDKKDFKETDCKLTNCVFKKLVERNFQSRVFTNKDMLYFIHCSTLYVADGKPHLLSCYDEANRQEFVDYLSKLISLICQKDIKVIDDNEQ